MTEQKKLRLYYGFSKREARILRRAWKIMAKKTVELSTKRKVELREMSVDEIEAGSTSRSINRKSTPTASLEWIEDSTR